MNFSFYQNQCAKLNIHQNHLEGLTRFFNLTQVKTCISNQFPDADAAGGDPEAML